MKKILSLIFVFVLTVAITLGLASCGKDVEFNVNFIVDGEVYATVGTSGEETIKIPENPTKDGYIFDGWYWDNGTWQKPFTANSLLDAPLSENISVYAKWVCAHSASDWILDTDATCKEVGSKHKECTKCEEVLETGTIDKLTTHTPASAAIENKISSTCSKLGSYDEVVKCSVCGIELSRVEKEISKKDHTPITDSRVEPTDTEDGLTEGSHCSECGAIIVAQEKIPALVQGTEFKSAALAIEGDKITCVFSNATVVFSFLNDINVAKDANYVVARDIYCESVINSKTVTLEEGDNTFYLLVTNGDSMKLYTATLRRRPMYTVRFNANGGTSISTQYVEEGYLAEEPSTTRIGYTFVSWDYNFDTPITSNVTIKASWDANDDTPYKVEYYLQNLDKTGYDLVTSEEEKLSGTTDTTAYAEQKTFEHFTLNSYMSTLSGNINGNCNLVLKVYYTRNTYNISTSRNNTKAGTVTSGGTYLYDKEITLTATTNTGYTFLGWFDGETNVCDTLSYSFKVDHSTTYTAKWETNVYNITYKLNGGVNNESNVATYTIETPTITLSSPERTGYEFGGWFFDEEFTTPATKITLGSYGEKTFYAKWTPIVYKITYDHNYQGATTDTA